MTKVKETPLVELLKKSGSMSVQQLTAYHTIMIVHRVINSGYPKYLFDKLKLKQPGDRIFPHRQLNTIQVPNVNLTLSRGGFIYRGATLWNLLPATLRSETKQSKFKSHLKKWIRTNISPRPP